MPTGRNNDLSYNRTLLEHILLNTSEFSSLDKHMVINIIPELKPMVGCPQKHPAHVYDVFNHTIKVIESIECDPILKFVALLHDSGKPYMKSTGEDGIDHFKGHEIKSTEIAKKVLAKLGYGEKLMEKVYILIKYHDLPTKPTFQSIYETAALVGKENLYDLLRLQIADMKGHEENYGNRKIKILKEVVNCIELGCDP